MEYVQIASLPKASRVGLGTWAIGGWMWGGTDEAKAIDAIHQALDMGITLIDTALVYGFGESEKICGKALKNYGKRDKIVLATKTGLSWDSKNQIYRNAGKNQIFKEIEISLKNLQVDYIDLYQVHWPDPETPIAETAEAMAALLESGKIRAIGVSNFSVEMIKEFTKTAPVHAVQPPYNMFERDAEKEILPFCHKENIKVLGYGTLCRGLLTGKMKSDTKFEGDDIRKIDPKFQEPHFSRYIKTVWELDQWSREKYKKPVIDLAVRFALDKGVDIALWGARRPEQLKPIEDLWDWRLANQDIEEIEDILQKYILEPIGPEFMAPPGKTQWKKAS
ncbi:MAG: aldo/keto reductase AkrN [Simkaniaceae bacterium]